MKVLLQSISKLENDENVILPVPMKSTQTCPDIIIIVEDELLESRMCNKSETLGILA